MSDRTKSLKKSKNLLTFMDWMLTLAPLIIFGIMGFMQAQPKEKLCLGAICMISLIFCLVNIVMKCNYRFFVWLTMLGIYVCMDNLLPVLITLVVCSFLDELIVIPLKDHYNQRYITNKEIDARG